MTDDASYRRLGERRAAAIIEDVHVSYKTYEDPRRSLRQLGLRSQRERRTTYVHAVRGVSMKLYEGETLGFIGANGSGKSTLLTALTGLLPIDSGRMRVRSRPRLLGVNAALRPGVSGRKNIVIGGLALGISLQEINERMTDIVEFVDIGEAIDRPMRTYSSGMRSRLGFAIATLSTPEILLIDEALVVGDMAFKQRSQERIDKIREAAGSIVLVTHNLLDVANTCDRAIWLHEGQVRGEGDAAEVVDQYREMVETERGTTPANESGSPE